MRVFSVLCRRAPDPAPDYRVERETGYGKSARLSGHAKITGIVEQ